MTISASVRRACVFAHYDRDGVVDPYVIFLVRALKAFVNCIVFVSTSPLRDDAIARLKDLGLLVRCRENVGWDFCSYKLGLSLISARDYDEIILCNDSVYGPVTPITDVFESMAERRVDFWGITESYEVERHLQSYFLVFRRAVLESPVFDEFWRRVSVVADKREVIERYEVGLTKELLLGGFLCGAFVSAERRSLLQSVRYSWRQYARTVARRWAERRLWLDIFSILFQRRHVGVNPTHLEWRTLLLLHKAPFIKVELLRDNPKRISGVEDVQDVIRQIGDYPFKLIEDHLSRIGRVVK